jgi:putative membrane protein
MPKPLMPTSRFNMNAQNLNERSSTPADTSPAEWQRVSLIAVIYFLLTNIKHALNLWPALVGMLANQHARAWLFTYGVPALVLIVLTFAFLSYWFFRYQFDAEKIQIRSGVFHKKRLTLNFERVQEANLEQAIYFRPFALWTLRLESAGSNKEEIALPGISEVLALAIKQRVLSSKEEIREPFALAAETAVDFSLKLKLLDLIRYGLMHNTMIYLAAIIASLLGQNDSLWRSMGAFVEQLGVTRWLLDYLAVHDAIVGVFVVVILLAIFFIAIYSLSIVLAVIKYWNYSLSAQGERLQYEAGLFNRVACGFRKHKLQTIIIKQSLLARLLNRYSLEIRQTNERAKAGAPLQGFIIPVLTIAQLDKVLALLGVDEPHWQRTAPIQILWHTLIWGSLLTAALAVLAHLTTAISFWWVLLPIPLITLVSWKLWYSKRFSLTANGFAVRQGLLGYSIAYIPQIKVQKLELAQGPLGRIHHCGSMQLWSGATRQSISYVDLVELRTCHATILHKVANFKGRWM